MPYHTTPCHTTSCDAMRCDAMAPCCGLWFAICTPCMQHLQCGYCQPASLPASSHRSLPVPVSLCPCVRTGGGGGSSGTHDAVDCRPHCAGLGCARAPVRHTPHMTGPRGSVAWGHLPLTLASPAYRTCPPTYRSSRALLAPPLPCLHAPYPISGHIRPQGTHHSYLDG
jgi:hypothetical protein